MTGESPKSGLEVPEICLHGRHLELTARISNEVQEQEEKKGETPHSQN